MGKSKNNIVRLVDRDGSGVHVAVLEMIQSALDELESQVDSGPIPKKGILVLLDDADGYETLTYTAGMRASEIIALLRVVECSALADLGAMVDPEDA